MKRATVYVPGTISQPVKLVGYLVKNGAMVASGTPVIEIESDKTVVELVAPMSGIISFSGAQKGDELEPSLALAELEALIEGEELTSKDGNRGAFSISEYDSRGSQFSPAVKNLLSQHGLNHADISASGKDGRLTQKDVLGHVAELSNNQIVSQRQLKIADRLTRSYQEVPHVTAVAEVDMSKVTAMLESINSQGPEFKLTYTAFFILAAQKSLQKFPMFASWRTEKGLDIRSPNLISVGVATDDGDLYSPVLELSNEEVLESVARKLSFVAGAVRKENHGSGFTEAGASFSVSSYGQFGTLLATPIIINQPQIAALGLGKIEKKVVVEEGPSGYSTKIKPMMYASITIDHRFINGALASEWLSDFKFKLENWIS